jgi:hypothetical protein
VPGDGIGFLMSRNRNNSFDVFESSVSQIDLLKFVPASGAATRMFKDLFEWKNALSRGILSLSPSAREFLNNLDKFAFYSELKKHLFLEE